MSNPAAFGGSDDALVPRNSILEAWREETTSVFDICIFAGGHFYLEFRQPEVLAKVSEFLMRSANEGCVRDAAEYEPPPKPTEWRSRRHRGNWLPVSRRRNRCQSFWRLLSEGRDAITEIPPDRIDVRQFFDPHAATPGRMASWWGGFLDRIDEFDADFFGVSPREAERLDPQQRLLLETAWEAFEDAGQDVHKLDGTTTGVFVGQWTSDFEARLFADSDTLDFYATQGSGRYASSGRISYVFGLRGPSLTIDTACSSSLAAVHLAVRSIRSGESQAALAGGANIILQPQINIAYSQSRMMSADGRCKFGDASGDGYVRSEGVAVVFLKALDRALADGDSVYAVIRGSAINNDGRSSGSLGRPSRTGQEEFSAVCLSGRWAPGWTCTIC